MPKHKPKLKQIQIKNDIKNSSNPKLKQTPVVTQNKLIKQTPAATHNYLKHTAIHITENSETTIYNNMN